MEGRRRGAINTENNMDLGDERLDESAPTEPTNPRLKLI